MVFLVSCILIVLFSTGVFEPLQNDDLVSCAEVDNGVLVWPNGLDLAPDTMYYEIKRNPYRRYELKRRIDAVK